MQGVVDGHAVLVGRPALLARWSIALPPSLAGALADAQSRGRTAVAVAWDGAAAGGARGRRHRQADVAPRRSRRLRALGLRAGAADRRQRAAAARRSPPRSASTT